MMGHGDRWIGADVPPEPQPDESALAYAHRVIDWVATLPENDKVDLDDVRAYRTDPIATRTVVRAIAAVSSEIERERLINRVTALFSGITKGAWKRDIEAARKAIQDDANKESGDIENAAYFQGLHGERFRYVYARKSWFYWDGRVWAKDDGDHVLDAIRDTADELRREAFTIEDPEDPERQALLARSVKLSTVRGARDCLEMAASMLAAKPEDFDKDDWILNCQNGVLDLRTFELKPHDPKQMCSKITACKYDPGATSETWNRFLAENCPDRGYLQEFCGYALTGSTREQVFVFEEGPGGGGKSTHLTAVTKMMGGYACAADFRMFTAKRTDNTGPREDLARLLGVRLVTAVEGKPGEKIDEGQIKRLTGGDPIVADYKFGHVFDFLPKLKLMLASNFEPKADETDGAYWRRCKRVRWPVNREDDERLRDQVFVDTLTDPARSGAAILAWAVEGLRRYLKAGRLVTPESITKATAEYRKHQNPLFEFVEDCCDRGDYNVGNATLYPVYLTYCEKTGARPLPMSKKFAAAMRALGFEPSKNGARGWYGLQLHVDSADVRTPVFDREGRLL